MGRVVLIGGGTHVHYSIDIIEKEGAHEIVGVIDSNKNIGDELHGYKVIGRQKDLVNLVTLYDIEGGIITIGDNWSRYCVFKEIHEIIPSFVFFNAIHPSAVIGRDVKIGFGVVVMAGVIVNTGSTIGNFTFFATGAQVEHNCVIGDFASLSAGVVTGGFVTVGKLSALTLGVIVLDRLNIGSNTVIGSGSLVNKSIPNDVLAYGHPAKIIRSRKEDEKFLK